MRRFTFSLGVAVWICRRCRLAAKVCFIQLSVPLSSELGGDAGKMRGIGAEAPDKGALSALCRLSKQFLGGVQSGSREQTVHQCARNDPLCLIVFLAVCKHDGFLVQNTGWHTFFS